MLKNKSSLLVVSAITAALCTIGCGPEKHQCTPVAGAKVMEFRVVTNNTGTSFSSKQVEELLKEDSELLGEPAKFMIHSATPSEFVGMEIEHLPVHVRPHTREVSGWEVYVELCDKGLQNGNEVSFKDFSKGAYESQVAYSVDGKFLGSPFFESEEGLYPKFSIEDPHGSLMTQKSANRLATNLTALVVGSESVFGDDSPLPNGKVVYSNSMTLIPTVGEFSMFLDGQGPTLLEPHYFSFQPGEHYPVLAHSWVSFGVSDELFLIRASPITNKVEFRRDPELDGEDAGWIFGDVEYEEFEWQLFDKHAIFEGRETVYFCVHRPMPMDLLTAAIEEGIEFGTKLVVMTNYKVIPGSMPDED
ncbi:MAG: hypothetical protein HQ519_09825 [Planctomycetes bacterium]|nr:hypothetical protein [Planctomycetota bacterium]